MALTISRAEASNLLASGLEDGHEIPHSCKAGFCGLCECKVVEVDGTVNEVTEKETSKLGAEKLAEGRRLACCVEFSGTVTIEL